MARPAEVAAPRYRGGDVLNKTTGSPLARYGFAVLIVALATGLAATAADYFFLSPIHSFAVDSAGNAIRLAVFGLAGTSASLLVAALRSVGRRVEVSAGGPAEPGDPARERGALPSDSREGEGLRPHRARSGGMRGHLERGSRAHQGLGGGGDRRAALLPFLHRGRHRAQPTSGPILPKNKLAGQSRR